MRLRVGLGKRLEYQGVAYYAGQEFEVDDDKAAAFLMTGLVIPSDGVWPSGLHSYRDARDPQ